MIHKLVGQGSALFSRLWKEEGTPQPRGLFKTDNTAYEVIMSSQLWEDGHPQWKHCGIGQDHFMSINKFRKG